MTKRILSIVTIALLFGCGLREKLPLNEQVITQNAVCDSVPEYGQYSVMQYVAQQKDIIPALEQMFVPQGLAYWAQKDWWFISGYFRPVNVMDGGALIAVDAKTGKYAGIWSIVDGDGNCLDGHFSGIAVTERDLYVSHGSELLRVSLRGVDEVGTPGVVNISESLRTGIHEAGCNYSNGILWVCEHFRSMDIRTNASGKMIGYKVDGSGGINPDCVLLVPEKVQGITVSADGLFIFSVSYGRTNPSEIVIYSDPRKFLPDSYVKIAGKIVPLWDLKDEMPLLNLSAPPMSEGCCAVGDDIYLIFESAAYYYRVYHPYYRSVDPTDRIWKLNLKNIK